MAAPTAADVQTYLGTTSYTLAEIGAALAAELSAQSKVCRVPTDEFEAWDDDLAEALNRRVARNLALRKIPLAALQGDAEVGSLVPPSKDPEVRRLEASFRKMVVG